MRIATRLVLASGVTVAAVMTVYGLIALEQRKALLGGAHERETETLAVAVQSVVDHALEDDRLAEVDRVLGQITQDPETFVSAVVDADGRLLAGGPRRSLDCLTEARRARPADAEGLRGWADCDGRVRWVSLPVRTPDASMVLARRAMVVERDMAASRVRILVTTLALTGIAALVILLVLRRTVSAPLEKIMRGVRRLGGPEPPRPIRVPRAAGELGELGAAFNDMTRRLDGKRRSLVRETEERVVLERRLRQAEKFAAIGRLTGGLAHELGSPLNVIGVRAEAIQTNPSATPASRSQAKEIIGEVDRVAELIRGLTHVARRDAIEPRPVDVGAVARSVLDSLRHRTGRAEIDVDLQVPDAKPVVDGDATLLRHAIHHLALNAVQALERRDGERRLWIRIEPDEHVVRVVVEDNGPGIDPGHLPWVTEPFFTTKDVGEGTGLGLAISLGIVEEHGGRLELDARDAGGVRATATLPEQAPEHSMQPT